MALTQTELSGTIEHTLAATLTTALIGVADAAKDLAASNEDGAGLAVHALALAIEHHANTVGPSDVCATADSFLTWLKDQASGH